MRTKPLTGQRVLVMEDEFLIAMDVEQLCRESGAEGVVIAHSIGALGAEPFDNPAFDVAILDVRLGGETTMEFAAQLAERGIPFIFATGHMDNEGRYGDPSGPLTDVPVVTKPYSGDAVVDALVRAIENSR